ncbi:MAG: hypothetical protein OQK12_17570 [Motiliproteus sp.]|nr:hypothetical protein [Motiliproteus sp.]MCW9053714.1 hypothetical protein [Motiliproteus sp.]
MPKNNDKELLNKISFSNLFPLLTFRFSGADFHLRGDGGNIDHTSKERPTCFLRLNRCKLISNDIELGAKVDIFPFDEYIRRDSEEELSRRQEYLFKKDIGWKNTPLEHWGHGYIVYSEAHLTLYCSEKEFEFIQNMLLYNSNTIKFLKNNNQELSLTVRISHPNFLNEQDEMEEKFYEKGVWYDNEVFCVDGWTAQYSD